MGTQASPVIPLKPVHIQMQVGLGLAYQFHQSRILFLYRYLNAGHAQLGPTLLQNTQQHLSTGILSYQILSLGWEFHFA